MAQQTIQPIAVDINIPEGEFCYYREKVDLYEEKTVTKSVSFHGPTLRLKIIPGLYYRAGNLAVGKKTENVFGKTDSGILYITSTRLIFTGSHDNESILYKKILDCKVHGNGLEIVRDGSSNKFFQIKKNFNLAEAIIRHFMTE